eukprot:g3294.t1
MNNPLETPEQREVVLAAITRGYQVMTTEREMMAEMCINLQQEQEQISELLNITRSDLDTLAQMSSDSGLVSELEEKVKTIFELHERTQPMLEKAAELCGKASEGKKQSQQDFNQLFQDLLTLKERQE